MTTSPLAARRCNSAWGATAILVSEEDTLLHDNDVNGDSMFSIATVHAKQRGWVDAEDCVVGVVSNQEREGAAPPQEHASMYQTFSSANCIKVFHSSLHGQGNSPATAFGSFFGEERSLRRSESEYQPRPALLPLSIKPTL